MTIEQREDLLLEWRLTSTKVKHLVHSKYHRLHGNQAGRDQWEAFLVKELNLEQSWRARGL